MKTQPINLPEWPADLWRRDEALCRAGQLVETLGERLRVVSFDFFDTLVWRLVAKPTDAFYEVGRRLADRGLFLSPVCEDEFEGLRRHAEAKARQAQAAKNSTREDLSLEEIYDQLGAIIKEPRAGAALEHETECDLCQVNPSMLSFVHHLRQLGLRVVIVSDIYFSAEQLRAILRANHLDPALFEQVLTSCDAGVCKGTGNLFKRALSVLGVSSEQVLHVGDNYSADVVGARRAGIRACHYPQTTPDLGTVLEREKFLLGGHAPRFSANSLRVLAARQFPRNTAEGQFAQAGAMVLGPVLTRFAGWACAQYAEAGVRKVGAFMREGELIAAVLQREAASLGHDLEVTPMYINRKATALAALGRLTADKLIGWLQYRSTLPIKSILKHLGLSGEELRSLPFNVEETADTPERILKLADFLFTPKTVKRIEQKSAEERRKVLDYLRPWLESGAPVGVCDLGYSASAQSQLKKIMQLEGISTPLVGCYVVGGEGAAARRLESVDVRAYLSCFGQNHFYLQAFLRSPAFLEQSMVAPAGTTLGYRREADGTVVPVLDELRFAPEILRRQQSFREGVLWFQQLWHGFRARRPGLLEGSSEASRHILADIDRGFLPILGRAAAFPLSSEVALFGALPLDDYYYANSFKAICGPEDRQVLQKRGYAQVLAQPDIYWPHAVHAADNPAAASSFFSYGKALLLCHPQADTDGARADLAVFVESGSEPRRLQECLARLKSLSNRELRCEIFLLVPAKAEALINAARETMQGFPRFNVVESQPRENPLEHLTRAMDTWAAPLCLFLGKGTLLPPGWDAPLWRLMRSAPDIGAAFIPVREQAAAAGKPEVMPAPSTQCFLIRRSAFIEGLGFSRSSSSFGAAWDLMTRLKELHWRILRCEELVAESSVRHSLANGSQDALFPGRTLPGFQTLFSAPPTIQVQPAAQAAADSSKSPQAEVVVTWMGSFLDFGSLSYVNRELTRRLAEQSGLRLAQVGTAAAARASVASPELQALGSRLLSEPPHDAHVTVRHAWPPDWRRPATGKLVVIQPWEYGALPQEWVANSRQVDEFWVPSHYVREVYVTSGVAPEKVQVVPNGVAPDKFHPDVAPLSLATRKKFKFLFVGGTIHRKGADVLLRTYLNTFTAADDVCLVIKDFGGQTFYAGQTLEKAIEEARQRPGAPEILYLTEELAPESIPALYTACDCLAHPYRGEGFGLPLLEAMACGLPVIVTAGGAADDFAAEPYAYRIPAARKFIGNSISGMKLAGPGWLLEPDAQALAARMKWVVEHPDEARAKGQAATDYVRRDWTWERAARQIAERLKALAGPAADSSPGATPNAQRPTLNAQRLTSSAPRLQLPPCALLGHLGPARELLSRNKPREAWESALAAIKLRPFHPEAYLLLAEIAASINDGQGARQCAEHARRLAPGFKPARQFLNRRLKGNSRPAWLVLPEAMTAPSLSVCLIVKNEEKFIVQCLQSVRELAHQIVVVDTGSTDRTVELAKGQGAELHEFTWCDDFSAARNAALEHATGDWVLVLDADEELSAQDCDKLRAHLNEAAVLGWRLPLVDVGREALGRSYVPRLFRNAPGLFYIGRIHEQVFTSLEVRRAEWGLESRMGTATLVHHGYTAEVMRERKKVERNLALLEQAVGEMPNEPHLLMNLGLELSRSGRENEALERYRQAFQAMASRPPAQVTPEGRETLLVQYCTRLSAARQFEEIVQVLTSPLAQAGSGLNASLHFALGLARMELGQPREALEQLERCVAKRGQPSLAPVHPDVLSAAPFHCLALCHARLGNAAAAEKAFQEGLKEAGHGEKLRLDYARFLAEHGRPVEALQSLHAMVSENTQTAAAWRFGGQIALSRAEFLEFARDWTNEAITHLPQDDVLAAQRAEVLLLSQDTAAARGLWERLWANDRRPVALAALLLCDLVQGGALHAPQTEAETAAVTRAFIDWYRRCLGAGAKQVVVALNARTAELRRVLPEAAQILEAVNSAAGQPAPAEACVA